MEFSRFLKAYPARNKPDHRLFFCTRTGSKVLVPHALADGDPGGNSGALAQGPLGALGFLVPDAEAEALGTPALIAGQNEKNTALTVTIVLNLDCNFSCTYCYEGSRKGDRYLSPDTARQVVAFIKKRFTAEKNMLVVDFFGGEPLLSQQVMEDISRQLRTFAHGRGATFFSTLITNGSLLKRSVAERFAALGLHSAKITLDGPARIHNRLRPFRSGAPSFDVIVNNIRNCCDLVKISIGGNYTQDTWRAYPALLDHLAQRGITPDKLYMVKFDPVMDTGENNATMPEHAAGCRSINDPWILEAEAFLREEILKRGYKTPKIGPLLCAIEHRDQFVVNYNGDLYKCQGFLGHAGYVIGHVATNVDDYSDTYKLDIWKNDTCLHCPYLPMCYGGCRYMTFLRNGAITGVDCKKPYLDAQLETLVWQDIDYQL